LLNRYLERNKSHIALRLMVFFSAPYGSGSATLVASKN
jgi:hypothetical protein